MRRDGIEICRDLILPICATLSLCLILSIPTYADEPASADLSTSESNSLGEFLKLPISATAEQSGAIDSVPLSTPAPTIFGLAGIALYPFGERTGPNGVDYRQLFSLEMNLNLWLWRSQGLYLTSDLVFWGQSPTDGVTNSRQGIFDFSKREFDLTFGAAWNYAGPWELRVFTYSYNNLNRGSSEIYPTGFDDGYGIEQRLYIDDAYRKLGTSDFDIARAGYLGIGYYPNKDMTDTRGNDFKPGLFAEVYLTCDLFNDRWYAFFESNLTCRYDFVPKIWVNYPGIAVRPFASHPRLEFRLGVESTWDIPNKDAQTALAFDIRFTF